MTLRQVSHLAMIPDTVIPDEVADPSSASVEGVVCLSNKD